LGERRKRIWGKGAGKVVWGHLTKGSPRKMGVFVRKKVSKREKGSREEKAQAQKRQKKNKHER